MPAWAEKYQRLVVTLLLGFCLAGSAGAQTSDLVSSKALRVCADPANYPMSTRDEDGYENKLAELVGAKLELPVQYTWFPMATGFVRNTLNAKRCDLIIGYAQGHELVLNTNHYFTSVYTIIVPQDSDLADVKSLADPALKGRKLGIIAGTPPSAHLARHGLIAKAKAYNLVVDRRVENPAIDMLDDLSAGEIDAAVLWGPLGGPLVKSSYPGFKVIPLISEQSPPRLFFRITMGVRLGEKVWQRNLNSLIRRNQDEINSLLVDAGVPLVTDLGTEVLEISN
ncbi:quinoprotein dehydrogenase-associated putative ABC transporter substrate-binding protein [Roseobacter denitrificans]|uniref:Putative methanol oxidation protein n=1 Tax=Roseobacter denitrificans (strain ATCC 33942 / OCh 114) TaxID=375451 RepID=Q16BT3_ROSDO|nr:substrate-binding domain-containing protein [Roseobacter denitrificans]ABG30560.1 putative methanol oxidation protein [Roseobacter denitrificans OCh 114]AVL53708.1 quinoprotein dehydrogenase-associated putative ABC transporter substrate-binding protein [Roseobacter denitrificans]SFG20356.1 amino acid ABC transporter substrate-binding protein, PAAT family [Roseobacter denitrificans OCh 114]